MQRHYLRRQSMRQLQGNRRALQGCFSSPEPGSGSPASPGILRALQELAEPDVQPEDTASPRTTHSTPSDRGSSPWNWTSPERTRDTTAVRVERESGDSQSREQVEEEVPLVNVSRAGQDAQQAPQHPPDKV